MSLKELANYRTSIDDINFVIAAATIHNQSAVPEYSIPSDPDLRKKNKLFIIVDTQEKILLIPPGLPREAYKEAKEVEMFPGWYLIPAPFTDRDRVVWLEQGKLGSYTAWDDGLNIEGGEPLWEGVRLAMKDEAVLNPTKTLDSPLCVPTLPAAEFTAPIYRFLKKRYAGGYTVPIFPELFGAMAHEGGSHVNIMYLQSWPDGHGDDNSLKYGDISFTEVLCQYGITIPQLAVPMYLEMKKELKAHKKYTHELLAYLTQYVETGIKVNRQYINWLLNYQVESSKKNKFGLVMALAILDQLGVEKSAKFGNALISEMIRDR